MAALYFSRSTDASANELVQLITVRAFLGWFLGTQRRGSVIVWLIRERLKEVGLTGFRSVADALCPLRRNSRSSRCDINTPLELAIINQTDRFSLAVDAIDRMPRFLVTGSGIRESLLNQRIACMNHAYEFGVDRADITEEVGLLV